MPEEKTKENKEIKKETTAKKEAPVKDAPKKDFDKKPASPFNKGSRFKKGQNEGKRRGRFSKPRSEFEQKIIKIRRVTRVMAGGRRFSFSVAMVLGDKKGRVGVGIAKASDTALAIEKASKKAKKDMLKLNLTKNDSIPYDVDKKYCSSVVKILPRKEGSGLSAGSSAKVVLELAGVKDVTAKILTRSKNQLNIAKATVGALKTFEAKK